MSPLKGAIGEDLMARTFVEGLLRRTGAWIPATPARSGNRGIDGLFVRVDDSGYPVHLMVADAKYGTSRLGMTRIGPQMGPAWRARHLHASADGYQQLADSVPKRLIRHARMPRGADTCRVAVGRSSEAEVWLHGGKVHYYCADRTISAAEMRLRCRGYARLFRAGAEGRIDYPSRVFRLDHAGTEHRIMVERLDPATAKVVARPDTIRGAYRDLPGPIRVAMKRSLVRTFRAEGHSLEDARALADRACESPAFLKTMRRRPVWTWRAGIRASLVAGAVGGGIAAALELITHKWTRGHIDWSRVTKVGGLGAASATLGTYVGIQATILLVTTDIGRSIAAALPVRAIGGYSSSSLLGGAMGGAVAGAIFAYGSWILGLNDLRAANRQAIAGAAGAAAGAGATAATLGAVMAYGTAGTGVAISGLSGAAATNAALAVAGGGTVAAGGGGMAAGAMVLSGGAAIVAVGVAAGVGAIFHLLDKRQQRLLLEGRVVIVADRVIDGKQPEWATSGRSSTDPTPSSSA